MIKIFLNIFFLFSLVFAQFDRDPRQLALGGAYLTIADDYYASGVNPALLASNKRLSFNLLSFNSINFHNSFFSLATYNSLNGADLENPFSKKFYDKNELIKMLDNRGINLDFSMNFDIPLFNVSYNNFAFTSSVNSFSGVSFPESFAMLVLEGNQIGDTIAVDFGLDMLSSSEFVFSYGNSFGGIDFGVGVKYIQGFLYAGMEKITDSYFLTTESAFYGSGDFLIKQSIGGSGLAFDLGILSKRLDNGWRYGLSLSNLMGAVYYDGPISNFFSEILNINDLVRPQLRNSIPPEYYLRQNEMLLFSFHLDSLNAVKLQSTDISDIFSTSNYKVVLIDSRDDFDSNCSDLSCVFLSDSTYLYPTNSADSLESYNTQSFSIDYPSNLSIGASLLKDNGDLLSFELKKGFDDSFGNSTNPVLSIGYELNQYKRVSLRAGLMLGGKYKSGLSFGFGINSPLRFDFALSTKNSIRLMESRGLEFSFGTSIDID